MPAGYSLDLRERVVDAVEKGASRRGAAGTFKVSVSTAIRWMRRLATTGRCTPLASGGDHRSKDLEQHKDWLLALVGEEPDATLAEIQTRLAATHGLKKSPSCLWRFFRRHDVTFKKKTLHAAEQDRPDVKAAREAWRENQASLDPARLVFIDETATATNMTRLRGRSAEGQRLIGKSPHGHRKTTTFVAALRNDRITAPLVIDGAMTGDLFVQYVEQFLVPTLTCHYGQPPGAQSGRGQNGDRDCRSVAVVPSAVFSGPEPDRDGVCQAQGSPSQGVGTNCRQIVGPDRGTASGVFQPGVRELPHSSGLQCNLIGKRSKTNKPDIR